jgi:LuxR family maltose regulon positive regulatory protein
LQSPQPPSDEVFLNTLLNEIHAYATRFCLVLDDYHLIETTAVHRALTYFIDHMPSHMQLIVSSRIDPPLPLARLRARGNVVEIRAADLAFSDAETAVFLSDMMKLNLPKEVITALATRTEGWAAGLQLAALALRGRADYTSFFQEFTGGHRYILGFFIDEVLARQPEAVQNFLLKTSILQRLCGPLCDAVTGETGSHDMLEMLQRDNLFTVPLDDHEEWYRYHHLFQDVLRLRLQKAHADLIPSLHHRASLWYEAQGLLDQAIEHAIAAHDLKRASDLIVDAFLPLWKQSMLGTLQRWIDNLPKAAVDEHAELAFWSSFLLSYTGRLAEGETRLNLAEAQWQALAASQELTAEEFKWRRGRITMLRGILAARRGQNADAIRLADEAFAQLPLDDYVFQGGTYTVLGLAHLNRGELFEAQQDYQNAAEQARTVDHWFLLVGALGRLAPIQIALGQLHAAATTCRQLLALPIVQSRNLPGSGFAHVGLAGVYYQQGVLDEAERHAKIGLELGEAASIVDLIYAAVLAQALVQMALGTPDAALSMLLRAGGIALPVGGELFARRVQAIEALVHLRSGALEPVSRWAQTTRHSETDDPLQAELESLVRIRLQLSEGQGDEALEVLQNLLQAAEAAQRVSSVIEILTLQARALAMSGLKEDATRVLERALSLAQPEGYVQVFINEGSPMVELLRAVGRQASASHLRSYIGRLLTALAVDETDRELRSPTVTSNQSVHTALIEPLTDRELDILRLIGEGASNEEIATHFVISIHTVRKHISNILSKLDVKNRTEAAAYARRSGIL